MAILKGRRLGGKGWQVRPAAGIPPSQVGGLTPGTPTTSAIPVSYTAASGTPGITYAGYTSPHGTNAWSLNGGSFTDTGGTFSGLSPSTSYDLRIVATNGFGSSTTDYLAGVATAAAGTAPSQVGSFTPATPSATTIPVTFTAASGTAPITYTGYTSPHGVGSWTLNGSLSGTGGLFTGLAPSTTYDLRVVAANSYGSSTTDYTAGVTTAAAPPNTLTASRFDLVLDKPSGAAGTTGTATIYPNAAWAGDGSKSITLSGTGVSFPNGASVIIPSSGTAPLTVAYSITGTGELSIAATNTGGLANPYPAPFNAFAASAGYVQTITSAAISANSGGGTNLDLQPFQRDVPSGNPTGWATTFNKGWGEVWVTVNPAGTTDALYAKLIDADSSGATTSPGTGTYLQSAPVQVYGGLLGSRTIRLQIPASNRRYYLELAADSGWTNPVRLPQRFFVGIVVAFLGPSQQCGVLDGYAYTGPAPTGVSYNKPVTMINTVSYYATVGDGRAITSWYQHANTSQDQIYGTCSSALIQEFARMIENQFGVLTAACGTSHLGQGTDGLIGQDGTPCIGFQTAIGYANRKFRYFWGNFANGSASSFDWSTALSGNLAWIKQNCPACGVYGANTGTSGWLGNGSAVDITIGGWTRKHQIVLGMAAANPMVAPLDEVHQNAQYGGHQSMAARIQVARASHRAFVDNELAAFGGRQTPGAGPVLVTTGSMASSSRVIRIPYKHRGGSVLSALGVTCSPADGTNPETYTYTSATTAEIASLFAVYGPGGYFGNGQAIKTTDAAINTSSPPSGYDGTLDITLAGASGVTYADNSTGALPSGFNVQYAADFGVSQSGGMSFAGGRVVALVDDQVDSANGIPFGRHIHPTCDIAVAIV